MSFENEEEFLRSLKRDDSYHFSYEFEYIEKNYGDGQYDIETTNMEVDVEWNDDECGYEVSFYAPDAALIDPDEGNGDIEEFYETSIESQVLSDLEDLGIGVEAMVGGTGRK